MLMGYSKEQTINRIDRILEFSNEIYTKNSRNVSVCGVMFVLTITEKGDNEMYHIEATDTKVKFDITADVCKKIKNSIQQK